MLDDVVQKRHPLELLLSHREEMMIPMRDRYDIVSVEYLLMKNKDVSEVSDT